MSQANSADEFLKSFKGKIGFEKDANPGFFVKYPAKLKLHDMLVWHRETLMSWDPKKESAAHVAARLGMSKSSFVLWANRFQNKDWTVWADALTKLEADSYDVTLEQYEMAYAAAGVYTGDFTLDDFSELEQTIIKKIIFRCRYSSDVSEPVPGEDAEI